MGRLQLIDRQSTYKAYKNGSPVYIGYKNKEGGAFWSFEQMKNKEKGNTEKERFNSVVNYMKYAYLPHTRIKYAIDSMKVSGLYVSEWDDGIEIVSEAVIDMETKEIKIGKHLYDYDFDALDLDILNREYVTIAGIEYPCHRKTESKEDEYWYK